MSKNLYEHEKYLIGYPKITKEWEKLKHVSIIMNIK